MRRKLPISAISIFAVVLVGQTAVHSEGGRADGDKEAFTGEWVEAHKDATITVLVEQQNITWIEHESETGAKIVLKGSVMARDGRATVVLYEFDLSGPCGGRLNIKSNWFGHFRYAIERESVIITEFVGDFGIPAEFFEGQFTKKNQK